MVSAIWSEYFLFTVKCGLGYKFSSERLDYYYELAKNVLKEKAANVNAEEQKGSQRRAAAGSAQEEYRYPYDNKKTVYTGITVSSAAVAIAGLFIEKTAIACAVTSLGVLGMAVGGYMLYNETKK